MSVQTSYFNNVAEGVNLAGANANSALYTIDASGPGVLKLTLYLMTQSGAATSTNAQVVFTLFEWDGQAYQPTGRTLPAIVTSTSAGTKVSVPGGIDLNQGKYQIQAQNQDSVGANAVTFWIRYSLQKQ